jgi:hypothetical protein
MDSTSSSKTYSLILSVAVISIHIRILYRLHPKPALEIAIRPSKLIPVQQLTQVGAAISHAQTRLGCQWLNVSVSRAEYRLRKKRLEVTNK